MIKSYVITITEIDDTEVALEEFQTQLANIKLFKNTVGIVSVNGDYFDTGVYTAVAEASPFPLVGMSAYAQNANGNASVYLLSILILTSDNCEFAHGASEIIPEQGEAIAVTQELYKKINSTLKSPAKLAFLYAPFLPHQCTYNYLKAISEFDETLPVFGSLASSEMTKVITDSRTVYGGQIFTNKLVMLLVSGNVSPQFYIGSITKKSIIIPNFGEATAAKDNIVMEINNTKAADVFEKIGIKDSMIKDEGTSSLSILVDERDSEGKTISSAVRGLLVLNDEAAVFGGRVPVGAVLSAAFCTKDVIAQTARDVLSQIKAEHSNKTVLLYSCLGRQVSLLDEPMMEYNIAGSELKDSGLNYVMAASSGELCPTSVTENKAYNSEHNQTLIACVF